MTQQAAELRFVAGGVSKSFGVTHALSGADLEIRAGEVHTLMGENGSGKSTLVKILSGVHRPDAGDLFVEGHRTAAMRSPAAARLLGISTVFQEVLTIPGQSILENVWIGSKQAGLTKSARRARAADLLAKLLGEEIAVDEPIESLSLSERQAVCIARSIVREPSLLVLDESTSALDVATRDRLFELVRELTATGKSLLFISHRMDEVVLISDVITVLRGGQTVASRLDAHVTSPAELVKLMSGVEVNAVPHAGRGTAEPVLAVGDVRVTTGAEPVSLTLRAGELLGLAGLEGQGQESFLKTLRGIAPVGGGTVTRLVDGAEEVVDGPARARGLGIGYVPRERRNEGIFEQLAISENFGLPSLEVDTSYGVIIAQRTTARLKRMIGPLRVKMGSQRDLITTLSGGNQQKIILARVLADAPRVLLLNDPTRGIDQNAKNDVYAMLDQLCSEGVAIVVLSSEVDELVHLADRVLVFKDGSVSSTLDGEDITRPNIVAAYFGAGTKGSSTKEAKEADHVHDAPAAH